MENTLDKLPGEGEIKTITRKQMRQVCENCGEPAHYKHAYLLKNYRGNPASKAYGRDDCTWCSDVNVFVCHECKPETPEGCDDGATTFPASERFKHMFLYWMEVK